MRILHNETGQQFDESNNNGLYQKMFVQDKWAILGPKMAQSDSSGSALRILLKFCRMIGPNRSVKILFFEKKIYSGQFVAIFLAFRPFFTVWLGMVEIELGHS